MSPVLLQPGVNGTTHLPNADLTANTVDAVYSPRRLQSQVVFDRQKKTRYFPGREAHRLDVMP
jgi:hypothetical protein